MNLNLGGQVVAVYGGANGIGATIAKELAVEGALVAGLDRDPDVATFQPFGRVVDVLDETAVTESVRDIHARFGRLDHAVYAVGSGSGHFGFPFWNVPASAWPKVLAVNLVGAVHVAQAVAPILCEAKRGSLLFLSSVAGQMGSQTDPPYSAAKAGLINFMQCAAKDLAPFGVRANALNPGMVKTHLNRSVWQAWADRQPPESRLPYETWAEEKIARIVPLGRWQTAEEIAAMAAFLLSDRAGNVTGQTVNVDGGSVMHS